MDKETLEEAAERIYGTDESKDVEYYAFILGAKWQSKQPTEADFKSKVIELIESEIKDGAYRLEYILNQIKQL